MREIVANFVRSLLTPTLSSHWEEREGPAQREGEEGTRSVNVSSFPRTRTTRSAALRPPLRVRSQSERTGRPRATARHSLWAPAFAGATMGKWRRLALLLLLLATPALAQQEPPYTTPQGNAAPPVTAMGLNPATGKAVPENNLDGGIIAAASVTSATVALGPIDTTGYESMVVAVTNIGPSTTIIIEGSTDQANWFPVPSSIGGNGNSGPFNGVGQTGFYSVPSLARWARARVSVYGSGTVTLSGNLRRAAVLPPPFVSLIGLNQNALSTNNTSADNLTIAGNNNVQLLTQNLARLWNGAGFDLQRNNADLGSVVTLGTASLTGTTETNFNARGVVCIINITAITGTSITVTLKGRDTADAVDYPILASAALTGVGTAVLRVYPGLIAVANATANDILPRYWHLDTTDSAVTAITATDDCQYVN